MKLKQTKLTTSEAEFLIGQEICFVRATGTRETGRATQLNLTVSQDPVVFSTGLWLTSDMELNLNWAEMKFVCGWSLCSAFIHQTRPPAVLLFYPAFRHQDVVRR